MATTLFITGTSTGVGKTLLTILLTRYLRDQGIRALAMKPFCSGAWEDALLLVEANDGELSQEEVTPVFCPRPLAPRAALSSRESILAIDKAIEAIRTVRERCDVLLVEGVGGAAVPLAPRYTVASMIRELEAQPIMVASNRLGVLSDLTVNYEFVMRCTGRSSGIVLMSDPTADESEQSNPFLLKEVLGVTRLAELAHLGGNATQQGVWQAGEKKVRKTLAQILDWYNVCPR